LAASAASAPVASATTAKAECERQKDAESTDNPHRSIVCLRFRPRLLRLVEDQRVHGRLPAQLWRRAKPHGRNGSW